MVSKSVSIATAVIAMCILGQIIINTEAQEGENSSSRNDTDSGGSSGNNTESGGSSGNETDSGGSSGNNTESGGSSGNETDSGGSSGNNTESGGSSGNETDSGGSSGNNTESGGSSGNDTDSGGSSGNNTESGGSSGNDTESGGSSGNNTESGGSSGNNTESGGSSGNNTESGGSSGNETDSGNETTTTTHSPTRTTPTVLPSGELFNFGYEEGDFAMFGDDNLRYVYMSRGFPTDSSREFYLYISTNGYIVFGRYYNSFYPRRLPQPNLKIVAPFWADATTYSWHYSYYYSYYYYSYYNAFGSRVYYQVYTNGKGHYGDDASSLFDDVNEVISAKKNVKPFKARWILKATWYNVLPYGGQETNTFQCILATDYQRSFTIFLYDKGNMKWSNTSFSSTPGIGFQMSDNKFFNSPYSRRLEAMRIDGIKGNAEKTGLWIFQLDDNRATVSPAIQCLNWYESQTTADRQKMQTLDSLLSPCPCSIRQAFFDPRFRFAWWEGGFYESNYCFYTMLSPSGMTGARKCCYSFRRERRLWTWSWGSYWGWRYIYFLNTDVVTGGGLVSYNPLSFRQYRDYLDKDRSPFENCCVLSGLCSYYRQYRWLNTCSGYRPQRRARFWGDPHITTLDGKGYTFNGWGEYVLLEVRDKTSDDLKASIQGRTDRAVNSTGQMTDATIFSAFALKDYDTSATMQAVLNNNKSDLNVICNSVDYTVRFQNRSEAFNVNDDNLACTRPTNNTLGVTLASGIGLNVSLGVESLEISVTIPEDMQSSVSTKGLLGVFNSDQSDDFTLPNNSAIDINSTEKEIFHNFGQIWSVSDSDSVFTYRDGDSASNHRHTDFVPKFLDDYPEERVNEAKDLCGENRECIFDYLSTSRQDVALETLNTANETAEDDAAFGNSLPNITVDQTTIQAIVNKPSVIQITATDADEETVNIYLVNNLTGNTNLTQDENRAILTWTPDSLDPVVITLSGMDPSGADAPTQQVRVLLCSGCSNNGECEFNQTDASLEATSSNGTAFTVVPCSCYSGWIGDNCDQDYDGCADEPCPTGTTCTDLTPEQQLAMNDTAFNCSDCPTGFEKRQTKCFDIDECNSTQPACSQMCFNTEGSFTCTCMDGYTLRDSTQCDDIDECTAGSHDCDHTCTNTAGSYSCSCEDGYVTSDNGRSCTVDPNNDPCEGADLPCEYGCRRGSSGPECFCQSGYVLENSKNCTDINECAFDRCSQGCINSLGGFTCNCDTGFKLLSDKFTCERCDSLHWGENCANQCDCTENAMECHNSRGCVCKPGWEGSSCDTDVNECEPIGLRCKLLEKCVNTPGSYDCVCADGYKRVPGGGCEDIDECANDLRHNCTYDCVNGPGGFLCNCPAGYTGDGENCDDVDECTELIPDCEHKCVNTKGSYNCDCYIGYELADDRKSCVDVDRLCESSGKSCNQICILNNTVAQCLCRPGYKLFNETHCEDIDECVDNNPCDHSCDNTEGGYTCTCDVGSELDNDLKTCKPCDAYHHGKDCSQPCNCAPGGKCNNTEGCVCDSGWMGDRCEEDVRECEDPSKCDQQKLCVELLGSHRCYCPSGKRELGNGTCVNIDECDESTHDCAQTCEDNDPGYTCLCRPGYRSPDSDGRVCDDIDECADGHFCQSTCENTDGGYSCSCPTNFTLDEDKRTCIKGADYPLCGTRQLNCSYACDTTNGVCFCPSEHVLESDGFSCRLERYRVKAKITLNFEFTGSLMMTYTSEYKKMVYDIQEALREIYKDVPNFSTVLVIELQPGSVVAIHDVVFLAKASLTQTQGVMSALNKAYSTETLKIGGQTVKIVGAPVLITTKGIEILVTSSLTCAAEPCGFNEVCNDKNGAVGCFPEGTTFGEDGPEPDNRLAIGLGVGIPLVILLVAVVFLLVTRPWAQDSGQVTSVSARQPLTGSTGSMNGRRSSRVGPS